MNKGVHADETDTLGRVWYHIPNLGPKFCDAVRKYSIVANYREAHVIARKKSKDSECMWVGIVGDPASYTTGSKRHIIDMMIRDPEQVMASAQKRGSKIRSKNVAGSKRRKRRRRHSSIILDSDSSNHTAIEVNRKSNCGVNYFEKGGTASDQESSSNGSSRSMSVLSKENSDSECPPFGFAVRESSPVCVGFTDNKAKLGDRSFLPPTTAYTLTVNTDTTHSDWLDTLESDPSLYALREPPLPSPENGWLCNFSKYDGCISLSNTSTRMPTPVTNNNLHQFTVRRYSVADLNEMLVHAD